MSEKCFCHLGGYEVKDAKARQEIEALKENQTSLNLKEVAEGLWANNYEFILNKRLTDNKLYMARIYAGLDTMFFFIKINDTQMISTDGYIIDDGDGVHHFVAIMTEDVNGVTAMILYDNTVSSMFIEQNMTIKIYELPFSL